MHNWQARAVRQCCRPHRLKFYLSAEKALFSTHFRHAAVSTAGSRDIAVVSP